MKRMIRSESGFSLPTVACLGIVAGLCMLGTAAMVVPGLGRITTERARDVARSSAEACLDWGVQSMNDPAKRPQVDGQANISVPADYMGNPHYTGTLTIANIAPPNDSYIYDPACDPNQPNSNISGGNGWRVMTATVTPNLASNGTTRTVRVILKPNYVQQWVAGDPIWNQIDGQPTSTFVNAAFGQSDIGGVGNFTSNSYDSDVNVNPSSFDKKDADVGTNTSANITGNSDIGGNLNITSPIGQDNTVAQGGPNVKVEENINANGGVDGFSGMDQSHINEFQANDPVTLPPVPQAPSGSADLGSNLNLSGNSSITLSAKGATITNGKTTTFIPTVSGSFIVNSISLSGNAKINIDPSAGPVKVFVQGTAPGSDAISLTGNGITGVVKPSDFRMYYGGSKNTKIAGNGETRGVIYAPNSDFSTVGNGTLYGAVVANHMNFNGNATFHYDVALGRMQEFQYIPKKMIQITPNVQKRLIDKYQAVSWDEL